MIVPLANIATVSDCIEAVNMRKVAQLRRKLRAGKPLPPISIQPANRQGYHVINDGNHRTLAHLLEGRRVIAAEVDPSLAAMPLSWRWPRVVPALMTKLLLSECGVK